MLKSDARQAAFVQQLHHAVQLGVVREQDKNFLPALKHTRNFFQEKFRLPLKTRDVGGGYSESFLRLKGANIFQHKFQVNQRARA